MGNYLPQTLDLKPQASKGSETLRFVNAARDCPKRGGTNCGIIGGVVTRQDVDIRFLPSAELKIFSLWEPPSKTEDDHPRDDFRIQFCHLANRSLFRFNADPIPLPNIETVGCFRMNENEGVRRGFAKGWDVPISRMEEKRVLGGSENQWVVFEEFRVSIRRFGESLVRGERIVSPVLELLRIDFNLS